MGGEVEFRTLFAEAADVEGPPGLHAEQPRELILASGPCWGDDEVERSGGVECEEQRVALIHGCCYSVRRVVKAPLRGPVRLVLSGVVVGGPRLDRDCVLILPQPDVDGREVLLGTLA